MLLMQLSKSERDRLVDRVVKATAHVKHARKRHTLQDDVLSLMLDDKARDIVLGHFPDDAKTELDRLGMGIQLKGYSRESISIAFELLK